MPLLAVGLLLLFLLVARTELARLRPALHHARRESECHVDLLLRRRAANGIAPQPHLSRPPRRCGFVPREPIRVYGGGGALH